MKKIIYILITIIVLSGLIIFLFPKNSVSPKTKILSNDSVSSVTNNNLNNIPQEKIISEPINNALSRVTKKSFGLKVSPSNSPVSPEKFSGYHTGVDFETLPDEQNIDVPIYAICSGPLVYKRWVSGYGGVAIQECQIDSQIVTVLYGHLKLASIASILNQQIKSGQQIGVLGKGYSQETDGERKHLHLGIHRGGSIDLKGYVQNQSELSQWIDAIKYF